MGVKKGQLETQRSSIKTQVLYYKEAKVYYRTGDSWQKAKDAEIAIDALSDNIIRVKEFYRDSIIAMDEKSKEIIEVSDAFKKNNPDAVKAINDILSEV